MVVCPVYEPNLCSENIFLKQIQTCEENTNIETIKMKDVKCNKCSNLLNNGFEHHACSNSKMFKCEKCKRIFNDESELNHHNLEKQCRNLNAFTCDTCKNTFIDFNVLKRHIIAHLENSLECANCDECTYAYVPLPHLNHKTEDEECQGVNCKCLKCNEVFSSQKILAEHHVHCDKVQNCNFDSIDYRDSNEYKKHFRVHTKTSENFKETSNTMHDSSKHMKECNGFSRKVRYECDACGRKFSKLPKLRIHILNIHHRVSYKCDKCNLKFINQEELDKHSSRGCKVEQCSCKICGKLFAKKDYLKKHEYKHSNVLYRCKFCHCAFIKEKNYNKHMEKMNCSKSARKLRLSEFNYKKCRICTMDFEEEENLIQHFAKDHPKENPHQCFCCDLCLPTFSELEKHIHLHNTQKYTCTLCNKAYTSQEGFRKHRLKHKGAEFKCQFCRSEFLNERRFKLHVKTCKKNPESGYDQSQEKVTNSGKDVKPKQRRQIHWESRIIMKHLRGDPNSSSTNTDGQNVDHVTAVNFFDERDEDTNNSNVRGWFDDYYKTEEDDLAFGLRNDKVNDSNIEQKNGSDTDREKLSTSANETGQNNNAAVDGNDIESNFEISDKVSDDSSTEEEEVVESIELPGDYDPKECRLCLITFSHEYQLLHHFIKLHPNRKAHKCPICEVESPLFAQLKEHMKEHGIGIGIYNCDNCSKTYRSEKKMKSHNIRCKGVYAEQLQGSKTVQDGGDCKKCGKKLQTKYGYRRHKIFCKGKKKTNTVNTKTDEPSAGNETKLAEIEETVDSPPSVDSEEEAPLHIDLGEEESEKIKTRLVVEPPMDSFPCRLCDKKFQYERGIVMHFKSDHPGHKPLVCHICKMQLANKLKEHLKTHGIGEEFICELCGKRFNQKFLSKIHEMWHQGIEYKCSNCKQKFLNKEKMDMHVKENRCSNRQSLMRLPCDICGKSYRSKFGLSKHYITHTPKELRPIKNRMNCEFCGKWFDTKNGLQRHRMIHTGERPFCCRFCSKSFVQEGNCRSHERIHTGEPRPRKRKSGACEPVASSRHQSLSLQ